MDLQDLQDLHLNLSTGHVGPSRPKIPTRPIRPTNSELIGFGFANLTTFDGDLKKTKKTR